MCSLYSIGDFFYRAVEQLNSEYWEVCRFPANTETGTALGGALDFRSTLIW